MNLSKKIQSTIGYKCLRLLIGIGGKKKMAVSYLCHLINATNLPCCSIVSLLCFCCCMYALVFFIWDSDCSVHHVRFPVIILIYICYPECTCIIHMFQEWTIDYIVVPVANSYGLANEYRYLKSSVKEFLTGSYFSLHLHMPLLWKSLGMLCSMDYYLPILDLD